MRTKVGVSLEFLIRPLSPSLSLAISLSLPRFPRFLAFLLLLLLLSLPVNSPSSAPPPPGRFVSALLPRRTLSSSFFPRALAAASASQEKEREENLRDGVKVLREKRKLSLMAVFLERNT